MSVLFNSIVQIIADTACAESAIRIFRRRRKMLYAAALPPPFFNPIKQTRDGLRRPPLFVLQLYVVRFASAVKQRCNPCRFTFPAKQCIVKGRNYQGRFTLAAAVVAAATVVTATAIVCNCTATTATAVTTAAE